MMEDPAAISWHLDKRIPISLIGAIIVQTFFFGWYASSLSERVTQMERRLDAAADQRDRLVRVETQMNEVKFGLARIEGKLDKLAP